jgi:hypothetical protein
MSDPLLLVSAGRGLQPATAQSRFQQAPRPLIYPSIFLAVTVLSLNHPWRRTAGCGHPRGRR